ncbi:hypothetical protein CYY_000148 [Polysphondylium violaceum]|uniref:HIG1 domain-containing protein n=1 Tax=Polysphondylium violaceum TaxID=133409 RepID=A0A8J4V5X5_9MYCE|nr:hypothetical protein CYY_000148 [Polysphondylium violaceum]
MSTTPNANQTAAPAAPSSGVFNGLSKKFTIPPPPKTIAEGVKRDVLLVGGLVLTAGALTMGVFNHAKGGSPQATNRFLRLRIIAQSLTVCAMGYYAFTYQKAIDEEEEKKRKVILT